MKDCSKYGDIHYLTVEEMTTEAGLEIAWPISKLQSWMWMILVTFFLTSMMAMMRRTVNC